MRVAGFVYSSRYIKLVKTVFLGGKIEYFKNNKIKFDNGGYINYGSDINSTRSIVCLSNVMYEHILNNTPFEYHPPRKIVNGYIFTNPCSDFEMWNMEHKYGSTVETVIPYHPISVNMSTNPSKITDFKKHRIYLDNIPSIVIKFE
jgi:hypothetical protein